MDRAALGQRSESPGRRTDPSGRLWVQVPPSLLARPVATETDCPELKWLVDATLPNCSEPPEEKKNG